LTFYQGFTPQKSTTIGVEFPFYPVVSLSIN